VEKEINRLRIMSMVANDSKERTALRWVLFSLPGKGKKIGPLEWP